MIASQNLCLAPAFQALIILPQDVQWLAPAHQNYLPQCGVEGWMTIQIIAETLIRQLT